MSSRKAVVAAAAAAAGAQCADCRRRLLHSFISSFAPALRPSTPARAAAGFTPRFQQLRSIHSSQQIRSSENDKSQDAALDNAEEQQRNTEEQVPWYMQVDDKEQPNADTNPLAERQRLPDLPEDPPPALHDILNHLSIDIGLDYLSVLDLRSLDPPAALGSNLIMIIGSARSERHLNVSADRFCRWLRTKYKLTPSADGLLGRNELKLKLKRKAKRSRMLGAYGAREAADYDDGTHTGWICVDVGTIENGPQAAAAQRAQQENIVGFGTGTTGVRLVVQVLTEDKRGDLDLEGLWQGFINRAARKARREAEDGQAEEETIEVDPAYAAAAARPNPSHSLLSRSSRPANSFQVRRLHTSARRVQKLELPDESELEPQLIIQPSSSAAGPRGTAPDIASPVALQTHVNYLNNLSAPAAIAALGQSEDDHDSTVFLSSLFSHIPDFTSWHHHHALLEMHEKALTLKHPGYSKMGLMDKFRDMQLAGVDIPRETFMLVIRNLLLQQHDFAKARLAPAPNGDYNGHIALRRSLGFAFETIEKMEAYGHDACTDDMMELLHTAISNPHFPQQPLPASQILKEHNDDNDTVALSATTIFPQQPHSAVHLSLTPEAIRDLQFKCRKSITALLASPSDALLLSLLQTYGRQQAWSHFWDTWRIPAALRRPRTSAMYAVLFEHLAASGAQAKVRAIVRERADEMRFEEPPVRVEGDVAAALATCLLVAAPDGREAWWVRLQEEVDHAVTSDKTL